MTASYLERVFDKRFDPNQPRDEEGRWSEVGGVSVEFDEAFEDSDRRNVERAVSAVKSALPGLLPERLRVVPLAEDEQAGVGGRAVAGSAIALAPGRRESTAAVSDIVHELAHTWDQDNGEGDDEATQTNAELNNLLWTLPTVEKIKRGDSQMVADNERGYYTQTREVFARAVQQYVAQNGDDEQLRQSVEQWRSDPFLADYYFTDEEFGAVEEMLERLAGPSRTSQKSTGNVRGGQMPYHVTKTDECPASKPWGVVKDADGEVMGCHETEDAAKAQLRALYGAEKVAEPRHKFCPILDAKALENGEVAAMFSVFGNVDLVGDRIKSGAFTKTLKRWADSKDPIPVIVSHQWDDVWAHIGYAEPADVKQMPRGVVAKAKLDVEDNPLAAQAHKLMKRGTFKGWSFGYTVPEGGEKMVEEKSGMVNEITELDLIEIGPTLKGANPEAQLQAAKAWLTREEQAGELGTGKFSMHLAHSLKAWDGAASNYTDEQYAAACVLDRNDCGDASDVPAKQRYSLPIKAPGASKPDKDGVAAAASRIGSVSACAEAISKAKGRLRSAYQQLGMDVPDSLKSFDPADPDVPAQEPREATAQAPDPLYKESMAHLRDYRTEGAVRHQPREEPPLEPPAAKDLRRGHRDLMLELLR